MPNTIHTHTIQMSKKKWNEIIVMVLKLLKEAVTGKLLVRVVVELQGQLKVLSVKMETRNSVKAICCRPPDGQHQQGTLPEVMFLMGVELMKFVGRESDEYNKIKIYYGDMAYLSGIQLYQLF